MSCNKCFGGCKLDYLGGTSPEVTKVSSASPHLGSSGYPAVGELSPDVGQGEAVTVSPDEEVWGDY